MSHTFRSQYNDTRYSYTYLYVSSLIEDIQAMRPCVMFCLCKYLSYNGPIFLPMSLIAYERTHVWI